jgi:hypothetical protein
MTMTMREKDDAVVGELARRLEAPERNFSSREARCQWRQHGVVERDRPCRRAGTRLA